MYPTMLNSMWNLFSLRNVNFRFDVKKFLVEKSSKPFCFVLFFGNILENRISIIYFETNFRNSLIYQSNGVIEIELTRYYNITEQSNTFQDAIFTFFNLVFIKTNLFILLTPSDYRRVS